MILDTSVLVAILQREPGWQHHQRQLEDAPRLLLSAGTMQELLDPDVGPVDEALAQRALQMFQRMGKGQGHAAQLNFGDCFAAALADQEQLPLAFAGEDFKAAGF